MKRGPGRPQCKSYDIAKVLLLQTYSESSNRVTEKLLHQGCLLPVNLGDDADTTGAIYGQLASAYYCKNSIPKEWISKLAMRDLIEKFDERVYELKQTVST